MGSIFLFSLPPDEPWASNPTCSRSHPVDYSARGFPSALLDPHPELSQKVKGSYTIVGIHQQGIELVRDGNIPASLIEQLLGMHIDTSHARAPSHPQTVFPETLLTDKHPADGRTAILTFVSTQEKPEEAV